MNSDKLVGSDANKSKDVLVFPAGRRNVEWYDSRILSDDNFRRSFECAIPPISENLPGGTLIVDYEPEEGQNLNKIAFLIGGYYIFIKGKTNPTLKTINTKLNKTKGSNLWVYIKQDFIRGSGTNPVTDFAELACEDDDDKFYCLFTSTTEPTESLKIPLIIDGGLNPTLDPKQDFYKPWFRSSAEWAAGPYSNKNKIWVDDIYDVPHVCVKIGDSRKWLPLGAVYKTANTMEQDNLLPHNY